MCETGWCLEPIASSFLSPCLALGSGRALYPDVPLTLLVDDHTASSSEVLGAALKAADRAAIAGEQTFGKVCVMGMFF